MSVQVFLLCLMMVSVLTGLITEGIKNLLTEWGKSYHANTLAGAVAIVLSAAVGIAYTVMTNLAFDTKMAVTLLALMLLSWLCAMVGYDKVVQAIAQFKGSSSK